MFPAIVRVNQANMAWRCRS